MTSNRRRSKGVWLALGFAALVSGALAVAMGYSSRVAREEAGQAESLPVLEASTLGGMAPGETVLVGGRLASDNPVRLRRYVAYLHFEPYRDTSGSSARTRWRVRERVTPPLLLETGSGRVRIRNEDYQLGAATKEPGELDERGPTSWRDEKDEGAWDPSRPSTGTQWYTGFEAGQDVVVLGSLASGGAAPEVNATRVFGGTKAELVASARSSAGFFQIAAWVLALVCAAALLGLVWPLLGRSRR
ncbi:MAG TPA: hypothetical protein VFZ09_30410 [Archangium sp.]|uniref:hypothetical protein n=1 Tax=Archangium sp. TaxID=1872627 RepID=UPI002E33622F|nr:hypothetical protein [Archangium sp.]HEX5750580.1 hypothetical protein [Archangium sp.]